MAQMAFDALADPIRREILQYLAKHDEATAGEIADHIGTVGRTAVSSHLRVLRTSAVIVERRQGRFRFYSIDPNGPVRDVLSYLTDLLGSGLDSLASASAAESRQRTDSANDSVTAPLPERVTG